MAEAAHAIAELQFPSQGIIVDRAGLKVDATGWVWSLNHAVLVIKLNFEKLHFRSQSMLRSAAAFMAEK